MDIADVSVILELALEQCENCSVDNLPDKFEFNIDGYIVTVEKKRAE